MQDIIQINATWGIDLNALRGILIVGKPLSRRELFTQHAVMIKDGKSYTGDKNGNIGGNTLPNFMNWLEQATDFTIVNDKILIENVNNITSISHETNKPVYKPYVETLFYDYWNNEYMQSFINSPTQNIVLNIDYSMINDYFPKMFNIFGDMYNLHTASYYDKELRKQLLNNYEINHYRLYSYTMTALRNAMTQNIDNTIKSVSVLGINKKFIYTLNGKPLTVTQEQFIKDKYIKPIRYNDKLMGRIYNFNLTKEINKQLETDFTDKTKINILKKELLIDEYFPICETWEIQLDRKYKLITPKLNLDFCRQKLNENAKKRVQKISGYDTILKYYNLDKMDFLIPSDLKKYLLEDMIFSQKQFLKQYLTDIETMIDNIA